MTAKPQPMAGQSDASDDLIAELAKLMAQDAQGDRPAQPARPIVPVRIPGGDAPPSPPPAPRFDFGRTSEAAGSEAPPAPAPSVQAAAKPTVPETTPEPFNFDFDLGPARPAAVETPVAAAPAPAQPVAPPAEVSAPRVEAKSEPDFVPADHESHDSIADLIAADLSREEQADAEPAVEPAPAPVAPVAERPVVRGNERAEPDRFKVAPVFGLASRPAPTVERPASAAPSQPLPNAAQVEPNFGWRQPASPVVADTAPLPQDDGMGRDPIDEIESLIGSAMRVELGQPAEPEVAESRPVPSPALRSLATPTLPEPVTAPDPHIRSGADEAILAAASAAGVKIGWVDPPETVGDIEAAAPRRNRAPRALGLTRSLAGPLVAVTLLLAAGFGLYWVLGLGSESGPAPLLTADTSPVKEVPEAQPDTEAAQQSVVFNEIDGVVPGAEEQLVSRDQADLNEVTQIPPTTEQSDEGLANRKVRTVTVRPDGTIVSGDDSVAGSTILPVDRPNVPDVPGAETASPELRASLEPETASATTPAAATPAATQTPAATPEPEAAVSPVTPGATVPAVDVAGNALAGKTAVIPMTRPAGLEGPGAAAVGATSPVNAVVNGPVSTGNSLPPPPANNTLGSLAAPTAAPATTTASAAPAQAVEVDALPNNAPAYVQLASQRTEDEARASAQAMVTRYGPLFGGASLEVQRVDLGERGIYYRVRVPANSMQDANTICTNVKAAGGDCFTM